MMRKFYESLKFLGILITILLGNCGLQAQSGYITVEVKIEKVNAQDFYQRKNDFRYKFFLNDSYKYLVELDNVDKENLEYRITEDTVNEIITTYVEYGSSVVVKMDAWGEDCGDNDQYNSSCGLFGSSSDKIRCTQEYDLLDFPYTHTEPGEWHRILDGTTNPFWCRNKYAASLFFRWESPKPPAPEIPAGLICKNENEIQFEVPDHPQRQFVESWEWERRSSSGTLISRVVTNEPLLIYAKSTDRAERVRYRQKFTDNETSSWSDYTTKDFSEYFHIVHRPSSIESTSAGSTITNSVCGDQSITLRAVPPLNENWNNQKFKWTRTVRYADGTTTDTVLEDDDNDNSEITDSPSVGNVHLSYQVEVGHISCPGYEYSRRSSSFFFFEPVPETFAVETEDTFGRIKQAKTSCASATDGKIIIEGVASEANRTYFYNIARKDANGQVKRVSILSSPPVSGNDAFTFPDNISYPEGETDLSATRWREYTTISAGSYLVQVINGEGIRSGDAYELDSTMQNVGYCFKEFEITIDSEPELAIETFNVAKEINCHAGNDGEIEVELSGGRAPYFLQLFKGNEANFATAGKETGQEIEVNTPHHTFQNLSTGHYKVRIRLSDGTCWIDSENSIHLDEPAALSFETARSIDDETYHGAWITCPDADDAYLEVSPTEGNFAGKYTAILYKDNVEHANAKNFSGTHRFADLSPGDYKIEVEDSCGNGPIFSEVFPIREPVPLVIDSVEAVPITCYGVPNGKMTVSSSEGTGTRRFRIDGGEWQEERARDEEYTFPELDSGWHYVEAKDINGCEAVDTLRFYLEYPDPLTFEVDSVVRPLCNGGSDGKLFVRPFGGNPITQGYEVSIFPDKKDSGYQTPDPITGLVMFDSLSSGNYIITVRDSKEDHACSINSTFFLDDPDPIIVETVRVIQPSCEGASDGSVHLKAQGGTPGTRPNYYYSIDGRNYVAPNEDSVAIFTGLEAGDYTFYAIDGHHDEYFVGYNTLEIDPTVDLCVGSLDFTLDEPEPINVSITKYPVTCYGTATGSITVDTVTGGRGEYTYEWGIQVNPVGTPEEYRTLTPSDPRRLTDVPRGNYRLIVRDTAGCRSTLFATITQPTSPLVISTVTLRPESCTGSADGSIHLEASGGYSNYRYQIDGGPYQPNGGFFGGLTAGAYMLAVRDSAGCEVRQMVRLGIDELTVTVVDQLPATVGFQDGVLRLNVTGGRNKRYFLDGVLSSTGAEFSGLAAGEYTVAIEYNEQCRWEQTYTIDEVAAPIPALRVTTRALQNVSCSDTADGSISVNISGGVSPYSLQWDDPQQQTTTEATNLLKGTYTLTVTDAAGVTLDYRVAIDGPERLEIINTATTSPACHQGADGYAEVTVVGGTAPYTYAWNDDQRQTTARASQLTAGTYTVSVTDRNGCTLFQEVTVAPTPAPDDILAPQAITLCTGQSVNVDAGDAWATYRWTSDHGFTSEASQVTIDSAGRYYLHVTNERGCSAYDTLELITTENLIDAEFLLPTEIAAGDTVVLTEVSWPAPEQTVWIYDETVTTYRSEGEKEYVIFPASGEYSIKLVVMVGECMDEVEKKIIVSNTIANKTLENSRLGYTPKNEYLVYPNPNHGKFTLRITTQHDQSIRVSVYDPLFKYRYHQRTFTDGRSIEEAMDLAHLKQGVYSLMIETSDEIKILRFVIR